MSITQNEVKSNLFPDGNNSTKSGAKQVTIVIEEEGKEKENLIMKTIKKSSLKNSTPLQKKDISLKESDILKHINIEESKDLDLKKKDDEKKDLNGNEDEDEDEEDEYDRNILNVNEKNFEKIKEETLKLIDESKYDVAIKNLNEYLSYIDRTKDSNNSNFVEIYKMRGECYRKLDKYIQATYDFQKSIDIASEQCSRSSKLHFSIRKLFAKHLNDL